MLKLAPPYTKTLFELLKFMSLPLFEEVKNRLSGAQKGRARLTGVRKMSGVISLRAGDRERTVKQ